MINLEGASAKLYSSSVISLQGRQITYNVVCILTGFSSWLFSLIHIPRESSQVALFLVTTASNSWLLSVYMSNYTAQI